MFKFLKSNPTARLRKEYERKLSTAMEAQRNGDIKTYSLLSEEAQAIYVRIQEAEKQK